MEAITITRNGINYTLTQEPYLAGTHDSPIFEAHATADNGHEYMLTWQAYNPEVDGSGPLEIEDIDNFNAQEIA